MAIRVRIDEAENLDVENVASSITTASDRCRMAGQTRKRRAKEITAKCQHAVQQRQHRKCLRSGKASQAENSE
jgi:hypothetical protein